MTISNGFQFYLSIDYQRKRKCIKNTYIIMTNSISKGLMLVLLKTSAPMSRRDVMKYIFLFDWSF